MMNYNLSIFKNLNPQKLKKEYSTEVEIYGHTISVELHFSRIKHIDNGILKYIDNHLSNLDSFYDENKEYIKKDFIENGETKYYVTELLEFSDKSKLDMFFKELLSKNNIEEVILNNLFLKRIAFYTDDKDNFIVFDYINDYKLTDNIVVVYRKIDGKLNGITIES